MTRKELARLAPLLVLYLGTLVAFPEHPDDEPSYLALAHRITRGTYVTGNDDALLDADPAAPDLWFGPGLPLALAPLVALDAPLELVRASGPLFLFGAVLLFYVLARDRWGRRVGLASAYGFGLYPPFWPLLSTVHSEPLAILCLTAAMLALARHLRTGSAATFLTAAAGLAGLALSRVAFGWVLTLVLAASVVAWLLRRTRPAGVLAAIVALALLMCTPWLAYTYAKTGRAFQWGSSGALSLYWMSSPYPGDSGDWRQASDVFQDPALAPHRPFFTTLRGLPLAEQNAAIERQALRNIADHPVEYGKNVLANLSRLLFNTPYSESPWKPNDLFYAVPNGLLVSLAGLAAVILVRRRGTLPPETGAFAVIAAVALLLHLALATYPRMLAPVVPLLVWLISLALVSRARPFATRPHARRRRRQTAIV